MNNFIKQKAIAVAMHKGSNYSLAFLILASIFFYMYFANSAVRTLTVLQKQKESMQSLSMNVGDLESKHLGLDNSINKKMASNLGLVEVVEQTFIMKSSKKATLSLKPK